MILGLETVALAAVLRSLPEELRLQGEYVVQHPIDPPALEAVIRDHPGAVEVPPEGDSERPIDAGTPADLRLLKELKAPIERLLAEPVFLHRHVPSTSTRPSGLTRAWTSLSEGSGYVGLVGLPSGKKETGWQGHCRTFGPPSHHSSHGKCEHMLETAVTASPWRKTKARTAPAVTSLPSPSLKSASAPTSVQRPFLGSTGLDAARNGVLTAGSSARPTIPPASAPVATPSPATNAALRVNHVSLGADSRIWASRCRKAGLIRCGPWLAAANCAAAVIASFSSASPARRRKRRPCRRSVTMRSIRFSGVLRIGIDLRRRAQRAQLHDLDRAHRRTHLSSHFLQ